MYQVSSAVCKLTELTKKLIVNMQMQSLRLKPAGIISYVNL